MSRYDHVYSQGPHGPGHDTYSDHSSAEYYDGAEWHAAGSLTQPRSHITVTCHELCHTEHCHRSHFALQPLCGSLVSVGGMSSVQGE